MKRPRIALTLMLGAMAALAMLDGFPPADRGVAADFSQGAIDPLCPADFPRVCRNFEWFERAELQPAEATAKSLSLSTEEDEEELAFLVDQAHRATDVYRFLMANFSWTYEPVDREIGLAADYNYGAIESPAEQAPACDIAPMRDIALGWGNVPALCWLSECDICLGLAVARQEAIAANTAESESTDASGLMATVRCESYDLASEMNERNQGLEPSAEVESYSDCDDFELALFPDELLDECRDEFEATADALAAEDVGPIDAGLACETFGWNGWPLPGDWSTALASDPWQPTENERCPIIDQRKTIELPNRSSEATPPCGDTAWYREQQRASDIAESRPEGVNTCEDPADTAARLSYSLADTLARMANLLNAASQEMEDVTERVAREAKREPRSARIPSEHQERRDTESSDAIWVEI